MRVEDIIYQNDNYKVVIGDSLMIEGAKIYTAVNRITGIVEAEEMMLPRIVSYANQLNKEVSEMINEGTLFVKESTH